MKMRLIDADELKNILTVAEYPCVLQTALVGIVDTQPTAYDVDKVLEQLKEASYERFGNDGMGGELVVNLDDVIEIIKGGGKIYGKVD
nr:MAG TPA: hypothetical protein [Caudoviricetes sp.]